MFRKSRHLIALMLVWGCVSAQAATVDLNTGVVGWWTFDEGTGNTAYDGSGNNNHATLMGNATWTTPGAPGKTGSAIALNGTSAFLRIEHSPSLDLTRAMTYEMWIHYTGTPADALFCKGVAGDGNAWKNLAVRLDDDPVTYRQLNWRSRGGDTVNALNSRTGIPLAEWIHVAVTFDVDAPGNNQKIYLNGKLDAANRSANPLTTNAGPLFLGAETYTQPAGRWFFQGMLDEGSIYNRALNPVEIKTIAGVKPATDPTPKDGATVSTTSVLLEWWQGSNVAAQNGHHVYFSDRSADVNDGTAAADKGFTTEPNYPVTGLIPGITYYWRVDEVNNVHPDKVWRGPVWSFIVATEKAAVPNPPDGAQYVNLHRILSWAPGTGAVSHRVYFSIDQAKVAAGATEADKGATTEPNFAPGLLKHDTIYYWRVDEFDGTKMQGGDVWSFETTASGDPNLVGWWTFEDNYLDISGNENHGWPINNAHTTVVDTRPFSSTTGVLTLNGTNECVYVPYSRTLDIATMGTVALWVYGGAGNDAPIRHGGWNASYSFRLDNAATRRLQFRTTGAAPGLVTNTGLPTTEWTHIALTFDYTVPEPGTNQKFYLNGKLDAENRAATPLAGNLYYVAIGGRENANSMWGGLLDDVRIYNRALAVSEVKVVMTGDPNLASDPNPADKSMPDEAHATPLTWTKGVNATEHDVYFGTDAGAVQNATPADPLGVYQGRQVSTSFTPAGALEWGRTYYWRIDEVNPALPGSPWKGAVWSFTVADFVIVDDFESYTNDEGSRIYETWIDGWTNGSGSQVGYTSAPFAEQTIVHGGRQSMPLDYNNAKPPFYSETERKWAQPQDWTIGGVSNLVVWFRGNPVSFLETGPGAITMSAWGNDIYNAADQCRFAYRTLAGNGTIVAKVESIGNSDPWAKGGVMIRESLDAGSRFAIILVSPGNGVRFQARVITDGLATSDTAVATPEQIALAAPVWVKLERSGSAFSGYYSVDGVKWTALSWNPQTINMVAPTVYVGLALTSHNVNVPTTASFSGITTTGAVTAGPWQVARIGAEHPGNSPEELYVTVQDSAGKTATAVHPDPAAVLTTAWTEWKIPLSSLAGVNLAQVKKLSAGVGDRANPQPNGTGKLYLDDIRVAR
ncbi:MAG: hypothetical protein MUC88_15720 [Planctomycetes bacterium]|jgi:hypothetical protein|nr:hypothetical protein [Planctomycetota bacterium]